MAPDLDTDLDTDNPSDFTVGRFFGRMALALAPLAGLAIVGAIQTNPRVQGALRVLRGLPAEEPATDAERPTTDTEQDDLVSAATACEAYTAHRKHAKRWLRAAVEARGVEVHARASYTNAELDLEVTHEPWPGLLDRFTTTLFGHAVRVERAGGNSYLVAPLNVGRLAFLQALRARDVRLVFDLDAVTPLRLDALAPLAGLGANLTPLVRRAAQIVEQLQPATVAGRTADADAE